jgi:hypothetical protein
MKVTKLNEGDWKKLVKMMNFLKKTKDNILVMSANDSALSTATSMQHLPSTWT